MARKFDLGDYVGGVKCDGDTGRILRPQIHAAGFVIAVYPHLPAVALIEDADGAGCYVKVASS